MEKRVDPEIKHEVDGIRRIWLAHWLDNQERGIGPGGRCEVYAPGDVPHLTPLRLRKTCGVIRIVSERASGEQAGSDLTTEVSYVCSHIAFSDMAGWEIAWSLARQLARTGTAGGRHLTSLAGIPWIHVSARHVLLMPLGLSRAGTDFTTWTDAPGRIPRAPLGLSYAGLWVVAAGAEPQSTRPPSRGPSTPRAAERCYRVDSATGPGQLNKVHILDPNPRVQYTRTGA